MLFATLIALIGCGSSPSVTVTTSPHPEAGTPSKLADLLDVKFRRPIEGCYKKALEANPGLAGTVTYEVMGSHGVLKSTLTGSGPEVLETCALTPMSNQRLLRDLGDSDDMVGFTLTINFSDG